MHRSAQSASSHLLALNSHVFNPYHLFLHDGNTVTSAPPSSLSITVLFTLSLSLDTQELFRFDPSHSLPSPSLCSPLSSSAPCFAHKNSNACLHHITNTSSCTININVRKSWITLNITVAIDAPSSLLSLFWCCASAYTATYKHGTNDDIMCTYARVRVRRTVRLFAD